jgi:hypothetical protein
LGVIVESELIMPTPSVFISYSHDSSEHKKWVLRLATDLRAAGVDASLDQWDLVLGQDLATFMQNGITTSDRVLLICSENYVNKADGGLGGVGYERLIVTAEVVESIETKKFIPIVRNNQSAQKTPKFLGLRKCLDFTLESEYARSLEILCRELLGATETSKPPLGPNPFSGEVPKIPLPVRVIGPTGVGAAGVPALGDPWFETQRAAADKGLTALGLTGQMEVRFALHDPISKSQIELLSAVRASEIQTFGWPIGVVLDNQTEHRPRPYGDGIRAEVSIAKDALYGRESYDYWALAKNGDFYLLQNLFEDMREEGKIFFNARILRVTEALLFASGLYSNLGAPPEARLSFRVAHRGLTGRTLAGTGGRRYISPKKCYESSSETEIVVILGSVHEALVGDVKRLLEPMFMLFEFTQFDESVYTDIVRRFEQGQAT